MMTRPRISHDLTAAHHQLSRDHSVDVELSSLDQLLDGRGRDRSGVDTLVGILDSALKLPSRLDIRIALPGAEGGSKSDSEFVAFREHCRVQADDAWLAAMALRQGGIRALPRALTLSVAVAAVGVVSGYIAEGTDSTLLAVLFYAVAFIAVIAAWTIGWAPTEQAAFDWRALGHTAAVYELLSRAQIELVEP